MLNIRVAKFVNVDGSNGTRRRTMKNGTLYGLTKTEARKVSEALQRAGFETEECVNIRGIGSVPAFMLGDIAAQAQQAMDYLTTPDN